MQRLSNLTLAFALFFAILILAPAFLSWQFGPYPLIKYGDVLDLFTPLILLPLYWLLLQLRPNELPKQTEMIAFMVLAGVWAMGQGMHLSANSIGHLLTSASSEDLQTLTHFYDEDLSHYLWHGGIVGLSALLIYRQWKNPFSQNAAGIAGLVIASIIYGITFAAAIMEGGTAPLGVSFALIASLFILLKARNNLAYEPLVRFFLVAYLLASVIFILWAVYWSLSCGQFSFPEPLSLPDCSS